MCAKLAFACHDSSASCSAQRFGFPRNARSTEKLKDAKVALDVIIRPSIQLWKLALSRTLLKSITFKRPRKMADPKDDDASTSSSESSLTPKKKVRFNERPVTITRRGFFERARTVSTSTSSPARPCLVIRESDSDIPRELAFSAQGPPDVDCRSVYEDCVSDYPGLFADLHILEGDTDERPWDTRSPKRLRRSDFYEIESGFARFDHTGYANYCLAWWLEKNRDAAVSSKKRVFEGPALLPRPSRTLLALPLPSDPPRVLRSMPPTPVHRFPRSLPWRIWGYIEDELYNAIAVLIIGLFIHLCLFLFLLYDILTRGLIPSDD